MPRAKTKRANQHEVTDGLSVSVLQDARPRDKNAKGDGRITSSRKTGNQFIYFDGSRFPYQVVQQDSGKETFDVALIRVSEDTDWVPLTHWRRYKLSAKGKTWIKDDLPKLQERYRTPKYRKERGLPPLKTKSTGKANAKDAKSNTRQNTGKNTGKAKAATTRRASAAKANRQASNQATGKSGVRINKRAQARSQAA